MTRRLLVAALALAKLRGEALTPMRVAVRNRRKMNRSKIRISGWLEVGLHGAVLLDDGCHEEKDSLGRKWPCGLALSLAKDAGPSARAAVTPKERENSRDAERPRVTVSGTFFSSPMHKLPDGTQLEVGVGPLNRFAGWILVDQILLEDRGR